MLSVLLLVTGTVMPILPQRTAFCGPHPAVPTCTSSSLILGDGAIIDLVDLTISSASSGCPVLSKEFTHTPATQVSRALLRAHLFVSSALYHCHFSYCLPQSQLTFHLSIHIIPPTPLPVRSIAIGSVLRRVLPSLAVTLAVFVAFRAVIGVYLRPHLMAPLTKLFSPVGPASTPSGAWILSTSFVNGRGQDPGNEIPINEIPADCRGVLLNAKGVNGRCLASHGFHQLVTYQPDSRFWAFQGMEAGIFLVLSLASVGFTWWWVRSRDA